MRGLFLISLFFLSLPLQAELENAREYGVFLGNKRVGTYWLRADTTATGLVYRAKADVRVWIGFTQRIAYSFESRYEHGYFTGSEVIVHVNGRLHKEVRTKRSSNGYHIQDGSKHYELEHTPFQFTGIRLLFEPPQHGDTLLSEIEGRLKMAIQHDSKRYQVRNVEGGGRSNYLYHEGKLDHVTVNFAIAEFEVRRLE